MTDRGTAPRAGTWLARGLRWCAALAGAGLAAAAPAPASARTVAPEAAPAAWVRYAETVTQSVTQWLQAESEPATRLRAYLAATRPSPDRPTEPLRLKLWIDGAGTVSRLDHPPFAHDQTNADLRSLVAGQHLPSSPPADMLLPLRISVQLDASAAQATEPVSPRTP